jgi:hypothetical protein
MRRAEIERLLPTVYQLALNPVEGWVMEPDRRLGAVLDAMETIHHPIEEILDQLEAWLDPRRAPAPFVPYLASWVDLDRMTGAEAITAIGGRAAGQPGQPGQAALAMAAATASAMPVSGLARLRELVASAAELARWRGTRRGLLQFLHIATGLTGFEVDEEPRLPGGRPRPFHFVLRGPVEAEPMRPLIERIVESEKPAYVTCDIQLGEHQEGGSS